MINCTLSSRAKVLRRIISLSLVNITAVILFICWGDLETLSASPYKRSLLKMEKVYDVASITPSPEKIIIEIQDSGPDIIYLYERAGYINDWFESWGMRAKKKFIENNNRKETLRLSYILLAKHELKQVLENKFPNAIILIPFISLEERIDNALSWTGTHQPVHPPTVTNPRLSYADIIVQLDLRQAIGMEYKDLQKPRVFEYMVARGFGSFGAFFDITINAYTPDASVVQFSTDYNGHNAEKKLSAYYERFNKPVSSTAIEKMIKLKGNESLKWMREYKIDSILYRNFPDDEIYWKFKAEQEIRIRAANKANAIPRHYYKVKNEIIDNYGSDFNTSPLYPLYLWTANSIEEILGNEHLKPLKVKRIREWARYFESEELKVNMLGADFWKSGNISDESYVVRLHKLMNAEIQFLQFLEETSIEKLIGEGLGDLVRTSLKEQDKIRRNYQTGKLIGGLVGVAGFASLSVLQDTSWLLIDAGLLIDASTRLRERSSSRKLSPNLDEYIGPIHVELDDVVVSVTAGDLETLRARLKDIYIAIEK